MWISASSKQVRLLNAPYFTAVARVKYVSTQVIRARTEPYVEAGDFLVGTEPLEKDITQGLLGFVLAL
jgi:hypothetical protein